MNVSRKTTPRSSITAMTLVEIMYATALGGVVMGAAFFFLFLGVKTSYKAAANVENSIQQWGLSAKLQIDGKVANGMTILLSADQTTWPGSPPLPVVVQVDNNNPADGLERGKILVLYKTKLIEGVDSKLITDIIFYYYTGSGGSGAPATGTLKRYPQKAPNTFPIAEAAAKDSFGAPKSVAQLVSENFITFTGDAALVQDNLVSISEKGPFAHFGDGNNVSIALIREESDGGNIIKSSNLTEVSFNLR